LWQKEANASDRWRGRPVLSALLRVFIALVPISLSIVSATVTAHLLPRPHRIEWLVGWWALVLGVPTLILVVTDRLARRALPLAVLLKMTMVFPDQAPRRFAVARRAGTTRDLARKVDEARAQGTVDEPMVAAEKILTLAAALNAHDRLTRGHGERVRAFTDLIADELHLPAADRDRLRWAALLHDIGKIAVHTDVLNKPGALDEDEWAAIRNHPLEGAKFTAPLASWLGPWANTIAEHHERYDGAGYPYGLSGEEISLGGRIVAVADSYDTMTALRSYKRPMSPQAARIELAACAGTQFDPQVVRAFLDVSIGRLRPVTGPLAWLGSLPFVDSIPQLGQVATAVGRVAATSVVVAGAVTAGTLQAAGARAASPAPQSRVGAPRTTTVPTTSLPARAHSAPVGRPQKKSRTRPRVIPPVRKPPKPVPVRVVTKDHGGSPPRVPPRHHKSPGGSAPAVPPGGGSLSTGAHSASKAASSFSITVNGSASSASSTYGAPATLEAIGLPAKTTGSITFFSTSPDMTLCTVSDYPAAWSCEPDAGLAAGSYSGLEASFGDTDGNYLDSRSSNSPSLVVERAPLTVTASPSTSLYGTVAVPTALYAGFVDGDGVASLETLPTCVSSLTDTSATGTYEGANTCSGAAAANYSFDYVAGSATVNQAPLTVTASSTTTTYGESPVSVTASYAGFVNGDDVASLSSAASCSSIVTAASKVGTYPGANTCSGAQATNYSFDYLAGDATVNKATLTVSAATTSSTYGTSPTVTPSYAGFRDGDDLASLSAGASCTSSVSATSPVANYPGANTCFGAAAANYSFRYLPGDAAVTPAPLTVTASSTSTPYGVVPIVSPGFAGFANGDGVASLTTVPSCASSLSETSAAGSYPGANTCSGGRASNYSLRYVAGDATVTAATVTITASSSSSTYGTSPTVTASYSGFLNGDGAGSLTALPTCSSGVTATSGTGTYNGANTCFGAASSNYSFDYVAGDATVTPASLTVTASSSSSTYGTVPGVSASYSGFVNGEGPSSLGVLPSCVSSVTGATGVGTYADANTCAGAYAANYSFEYVTGHATVTPASLTVTASSTSSTYGTAPQVTAGYAGFVDTDGPASLTSAPSCASSVTATSSVGSYPGANTCAGASAANYTFDYLPGGANVTPATLTVTASASSSAYGTVPLPSASYAGFQNGDGIGSLTLFATCTSSVTSTRPVGTYAGANTCSGAAATNYSFDYLAGDATVTPASLSVTASSTSSTYGTAPAPTANYAGFVNGDGPASLSSLPTCTSSVTVTSPVGTYTGANTCSGAVGSNYSVAYDPSDATVSAATLTVTASSSSTSYGTAPLPSASYAGFENGDGIGSLTVFATCTSSVTAASPVGSYAGANTCSGAAAANYVFVYLSGDGEVTPATLTITASSSATTYGTVPSVTAAYAGFQNGDGPSSLASLPTCSSSVTATTAPGSYPGANTCSGAAGSNYSLAYVAGNATVAPVASLTIINGGSQAGRPEAGDQIVVTFNPVPDLNALCSAWTSTTYPELDNPNVLVEANAPLFGDDTLTVSDPTDCSGGLNFGTIDLGQAGYFFLGTTAFGGPSATCGTGDSSGCSSLQWDGANTLTITLGQTGFVQPTQSTPSVAIYSPAPALGLPGSISSAYEENF
jgi:hypothetical protein